ncbi:MAG: ABC-2 family transporter protein, partial [Anaerolineales bacterium]|nr:ABC-2 family transporter protein [Anaerolineales bacterium]
MRHSLTIYWRLLGVQLRSQMQYRLSFWMKVGSASLTVFFEFAAVALVLERFGNISGWTIGEVAVLYGLVEIAFGWMDMIFSGFDPPRFGRHIRQGGFDQMLLRPVNITIQVFGSGMELRRLAKVAMGILILSYGLGQVTIIWTATKILLAAVSVVSMFCFFGGLFIIGSTITFWTVESIEAINILTYGGSQLIQYPMHIYQRWMRDLFTFVVPAIFLNYFPVLYLLDKSDPLNFPAFAPFASPLVGLGMLLVALAFWQFGIKHYQS